MEKLFLNLQVFFEYKNRGLNSNKSTPMIRSQKTEIKMGSYLL